MRKKIFGRRFKKDVNQRKALFRSLMHALIINESIKTTEAKAKAIKGEIEKLVTKAKNKGDIAKNVLLSHLANEQMVDKLINEIAPRFKERPGGYTRIMRLEKRLKDNSQMVILEWVEKGSVVVVSPKNKNKRVKKEKVEKIKKTKEVEKTKKPEKKIKKKE